MFLAALFPYGPFHSANFTITVLKMIFCLSKAGNSQKSELNDTAKSSPAVIKETAATPRTYMLK